MQTYCETKIFPDFQIAADQLQILHKDTRANGTICAKITCLFEKKIVKYFICHNIYEKYPSLSTPMQFLLEQGGEIRIGKRRVYRGKLSSSELPLQQMELLRSALVAKSLIIDIVRCKEKNSITSPSIQRISYPPTEIISDSKEEEEKIIKQTIKQAFSTHKRLIARSSKFKKAVTVWNHIDLDTVQVEQKLTSSTHGIKASKSILKAVIARTDIDLTDTKAKSLTVSTGSIHWINSLQYKAKASFIQASNEIVLTYIHAEKVHSLLGCIQASDCQLQQVQGQTAIIKNSSIDCLTVHGNVESINTSFQTIHLIGAFTNRIILDLHHSTVEKNVIIKNFQGELEICSGTIKGDLIFQQCNANYKLLNGAVLENKIISQIN